MLEFEATIVRLPGKMAWPVFYVPASFTEAVGTRGRINVLAKINGGEFRATLLPSSNGHYMVYNRTIREHCGKKMGEAVHVVLEVDEEPRELQLPEDVAAALAGSEAAQAQFASLPYYLRREEINQITAARRPATREKRIQALLDKLLG